jgi:hypothetical protein|tara:strand:- start:913 stop:1110 length:198 start_codon:yes stop_codon:yes gene_type:complete
MSKNRNKPLMRCLGEFVGHILHAVKSDSAKKGLHRSVEEKVEGNVTLRRTTIDEIEIRSKDESYD